MRSYRQRFGLHALLDIVFIVITAVLDFARIALRVDYGHAWRYASNFAVTAYRKIGDLKPVYRESYDTHGLSLDHGQMQV